MGHKEVFVMGIWSKSAATLLAAVLLTTPVLAVGVDVVVEPHLNLDGVTPFEGTSNRTTVHTPGSDELLHAVVENGKILLQDFKGQPQGDGVLLLCQDPATGLYGYADRMGAVVIPQEYDWYINYEFTPDLTAVPVRKGDLWGLVNRTGTLIVPCRYQMVNLMVDCPDYAAFVEQGDVTGKWGLMDMTGKVLVPPGEYNGLDGMMRHNGQWYVRAYRGGWGESKSALLDLEGNIFVPFEYSAIQDYHNGMAVVKQGEKYGFLGPDGTLAVPFVYDEMRNFEQNRAAVGLQKENRWRFGFIDKQGDEVIPPIYQEVGKFNAAGVTSAVLDLRQARMIDRNGKVLTEKDYASISDLIQDGLMGCCVMDENGDSWYGYLNQYGQEVIPTQFDHAQNFQNGLAVAWQDGKCGVIDVTGKFVLPPEYDDVLFYPGISADYVWIMKDGLYGVAKMDYSVTGTSAISSVRMGDKEFSLPSYTLQNGSGGITCVKLRDAATLLSGTAAQFNVTWDNRSNAIALTPGAAYVPVGGELAAIGSEPTAALPNRAKVLLDGSQIELDAYTFGENNYVTLRDLGRLLDFGVDWQDKTVILNTDAPYWAD